MKIYALNASPRKNWNSAQLLQSFIDGVKSIDANAEVITVHVYDYEYRGCRSCFLCKRRDNPEYCMIKDSIQEVLMNIRESDGVVFASPIYYVDYPGQFRSFIERLMYPGPVKKHIHMAALYSMNATEAMMKEMFKQHLNTMKMFFKQCFHTDVQELFAFDTYQRANNDVYRPTHSDHKAKKIRHDEEFPQLCKEAYNMGVVMAKNIEKEV